MERRKQTVKHINVDDQPEHVKLFLLSLDLDPDGSIIELDGKQLFVSAVPDPLDAGDIASIQRGIDQMEAGEGRPFKEVDSEIRDKLGFPSRP